MVPASQSLHGFFTFLDSFGAGTFPRAELEQALGGGDDARTTLRALRRAEIVSRAEIASTILCVEERPRCRGHAIREEKRGGRLKLVGVCTAKSRPCLDFELEDETWVARVTLSMRGLVLTMRRLFDFDGGHDVDDEAGLMTVGEEDPDGKTPRNVYLLASPDYQAMPRLFARLDERRRRSLVLAPVRNAFAGFLRESHGPDAHVELDFLAERMVLRDGALAIAASIADRQTEPPAAVASATGVVVTLVFECTRVKRGSMQIIANGEPIVLQDAFFALLVRLVDARITSSPPDRWVSYAEARIEDVQGATWRTNRPFDSVVPAGFNVIEIDGKKQCRLNPAVVVSTIDWNSVAAHPYAAVKAIAARHSGE